MDYYIPIFIKFLSYKKKRLLLSAVYSEVLLQDLLLQTYMISYYVKYWCLCQCFQAVSSVSRLGRYKTCRPAGCSAAILLIKVVLNTWFYISNIPDTSGSDAFSHSSNCFFAFWHTSYFKIDSQKLHIYCKRLNRAYIMCGELCVKEKYSIIL